MLVIKVVVKRVMATDMVMVTAEKVVTAVVEVSNHCYVQLFSWSTRMKEITRVWE